MTAHPTWQPFRPVCGKCGKSIRTIGKNDGSLTVFPCTAPECAPVHASDCATNNMPAYPNGPCDCGAKPKAEGI